MNELLRTVPLFERLGEEDLSRIARSATRITLSAGEQLFAEGAAATTAYVIVSGEIEIFKQSGRRPVTLAIRKAGDVIGEMALLDDSTRSATARASSDAELVAIPKAEIDQLMATSADAVRALLLVLRDRWQSTQALLAQSERMAQLGTLTAGLAHELNNPAAAVGRAAGQLRESVAKLASAERGLAGRLDPDSLADVTELRQGIALQDSATSSLSSIARADLEAEVESRLAEAGVVEPWSAASALVEAGLAGDIDRVLDACGEPIEEVLAVLRADVEIESLLHEVEEASRRLAAIVRAFKSYSYLDQAPVQRIDLVAGLEDTLMILKPHLAGIEIHREYTEDLPPLEGHGGELNQVWTNLIHNAADAVREAGTADGRIVLRIRAEGDRVLVEVEDNGTGIPPDALHRVFDAFFTTKPPGSGTGLGLNISYTIVVDHHGGEISVESEPGRTVFRVSLPAVAPPGGDP